MPSATAKRTAQSISGATLRTKGTIVRPAKATLTPSGLDEVLREHGGRPMTREERREFEEMFKGPYP